MLKMSPYFGASQTNSFITFFFPALLILDISEADFSGADSFYPVVATIVSTLAIALIIFVGKLFFNTSADLFTSIFQGGVRYNSYVFIALSQSLFGSEGWRCPVSSWRT